MEKQKQKFKNVNEVWMAIDEGKTIFWSNESYKICVEQAYPNNPNFPKRGNQILCVRCISNHFGSVLDESEISQLFTSEVM